MIRIEYINKEIKVYTETPSKLFDMPLKLSIANHVTKKEIWSCELNDNSWATFPNNEMNDTNVYDAKGILIMGRSWNVLTDGDILYRTLYLYCLEVARKKFKPNGLAIGTHDGQFGEWAPAVLNGITTATLVEASRPQYEKLYENYRTYKDIIMLNKLVTTDGKPVEFYEGGKGYTNSVVPRVIHAWEKEPITSSIKESIAINDLCRMDRFDWLHLDVEGYDASLINAIESLRLPPLIIFENNNMLPEERQLLNSQLKYYGYFLQEESVSTLAIKRYL